MANYQYGDGFGRLGAMVRRASNAEQVHMFEKECDGRWCRYWKYGQCILDECIYYD